MKQVARRVELRDDEVVRIPVNQAPFSIRLVYCDCGLTHDVKVLQWEGLDDEVELVFHRNRISTALNRSYMIGGRKGWKQKYEKEKG